MKPACIGIFITLDGKDGTEFPHTYPLLQKASRLGKQLKILMDIRSRGEEEGRDMLSLMLGLDTHSWFSLGRSYDKSLLRQSEHLAETFSQPLQLHHQVAITANPKLVGKARKHRKEWDLLVKSEVTPPPSQEGERRLTIDRLTLRMHPRSRIMKGKPEINIP